MSNFRDAFLKKANEPAAVERLPLPELGIEPFVRALNALDYALMQAALYGDDGRMLPPQERRYLERQVMLATVTADGSPVFQEGDEQWLGRIPMGVLRRIERKSDELSGFSASPAASLEERVKNSKGPAAKSSASA